MRNKIELFDTKSRQLQPLVNSDGEKFTPVIIDGSHFGDDFDRFNGETHVHDDGMYGDISVTFHQTFLTTRLSDEKLLHKFRNK